VGKTTRAQVTATVKKGYEGRGEGFEENQKKLGRKKKKAASASGPSCVGRGGKGSKKGRERGKAPEPTSATVTR